MKYHYNPNIKAAVRELASIKCGRYQVAIESVKVLLDTTPKPSAEYEDVLHVYTKLLYLKTKHQGRKQRNKSA